MKKIKLSQGKYALVDNDNFEILNKSKWSVSKNRRNFYAQRKGKVDGKPKTIKMHRVIMGVTDKNIIIDHINRNGLDNRKNNLRISTDIDNKRNRRVSQYKNANLTLGIYKENGKYVARISVINNRLLIGKFDSEKDAEDAYKKISANPITFLKDKLEEIIKLLNDPT